MLKNISSIAILLAGTAISAALLCGLVAVLSGSGTGRAAGRTAPPYALELACSSIFVAFLTGCIALPMAIVQLRRAKERRWTAILAAIWSVILLMPALWLLTMFALDRFAAHP